MDMSNSQHSPNIDERLAAEIAVLNPGQKAAVLQFVRDLKPPPTLEERNRALRELIGSISKEDLAIMQRVIETDCDPPDFAGYARGAGAEHS
jgi:hypothetical protein